jgi:hypothetical protein
MVPVGPIPLTDQSARHLSGFVPPFPGGVLDIPFPTPQAPFTPAPPPQAVTIVPPPRLLVATIPGLVALLINSPYVREVGVDDEVGYG